MHVQTVKLLLFCYFFVFLAMWSEVGSSWTVSDLRTCIWSLLDLVVPEDPEV